MTLLTKAIWISAIVAMLAGLVTVLPSGSEYPLPNEIVTATQTLYSWLLSFNNIFPVDTLVTILIYGLLIQVAIKILWPVLVFFFNSITGYER